MADTFSMLDTGEYVPMPKVPKSGELTMQDVLGVREPFIPKRKALEEKLSQSDLALEEGKQQQKLIEARGESDVKKREAEAVKSAQETYQKEQEAEPVPAFVPDKESAKDIAALFSTVSVLGMLLGGSGKLNAMQAMSAMNGMLEGHQKGRADLYKKQATEFDKNFKAIVKKHEDFRKKMEDAVKLAAVDKEAGLAEAKMAAVEAGSPIIKTMVDRGEIVRALQTLNDTVQGREAALKLVLTEQDRAQTRKEAAQRQKESFAHAEKMARQTQEHAERMAKLKFVNPSETANDVKNFMGVDFGKGKNADAKNDRVANAANTISEAMSLSNYVKNNPNVVGRVGQAKTFIDRYVNSLDSSGAETKDTPKPTTQAEQDALLFSKRYAAYLIAYEQSLAGSAKGFTVAFMKRFNDLMQANQFNPQGFDGLMKEQIRDIGAKTSALSTQITTDNLMKYGIAQTRDPDAIEAYARFKGKEPSAKEERKSFNTEQEAEAANLPSGTKILVGGKPATVE
jgi:hypothetical protein